MAHQSNRDDILDEDDDLLGPQNPYASKNRWRHQESSAFARYAVQPRDPEPKGRTSELASFLNSTRVAPEEGKSDQKANRKSTPIMVAAPDAREAVAANASGGQVDTTPSAPPDGKEIAVGPLLNYRRTDGGRWIGSVLVVTKGGGKNQAHIPLLVLRRSSGDIPSAANTQAPGVGADASSSSGAQTTEIRGGCLYSDPRNTFWRFDLSIEFERAETKWEYTLPDLRFHSKTKPQTNFFHVPAVTESMRVMFHSCNGFSVGTDEEDYSGACLWNDVLRRHEEAPFHVMVGGGDQIYNDGIRVNGPLRTWTGIGNPKKRREYPFPESLRQECDDYYLRNYIRWYGTEPFASANGQIAQINIWDDHDIIDGFGSYVNEFMKCDVFRGIGGTAHKYYMLFQHHLPPPASTYTTDAPQTTATTGGAQGKDPIQLQDTYVAPEITESGYIIGSKPGPYVAEHSHNMYARLGARMALLGIDARTERTRHQVNYPETYDQVFSRLSDELRSASTSGAPIKHLIVLLGIPIAYPRLTWLENVFSSPVMGPIKFLNRRFGLGGGIFNHFDGSVDLLDDLDDHYTARTHKKERNHLVERLQTICAEFSVRITILGGDVHLAALGRFYSNPKLNIPTENDFRYMANVVSSAIVNKPPPPAIANLLARRNKIHHLNHDTDETLFKLFDKDPGDSSKTAGHNQVTMPSRNFAILTENSPNNPVPPPPATATTAVGDQPPTLAPVAATNGDHLAPGPPGSSNGHSTSGASSVSTPTGKDGHTPLHNGEQGAGTKHRAAGAEHGKGNDGSLDVCIRVEIDQHDRAGRTQQYGITIPALEYSGPVPAVTSSHWHLRHGKKSGEAKRSADGKKSVEGKRAEPPAEAAEK